MRLDVKCPTRGCSCCASLRFDQQPCTSTLRDYVDAAGVAVECLPDDPPLRLQEGAGAVGYSNFTEPSANSRRTFASEPGTGRVVPRPLPGTNSVRGVRPAAWQA